MRRAFLIIFSIPILIGILFWFYAYKHEPDKHSLVLYGNVDIRQVDIGFRVGGRVIEMQYEEGDLVEPGALMGAIELQPYADQYVEAEASLAGIRDSLVNAQKVLDRRLELIDSGSVSQEDLENMINNRDVLVANLQQAEAAVGVAKKNLNDTQVFAPTKGIILTRIREPGTVVNPTDPIYTLSIISPVWVRAFVHEPELGIVYPGMPAEIHTDTPGGPVYAGQVGFISPVAEFTPKTVETTQLRTALVYRLRVYADNPDEGLRQGMPVTVKLLRKDSSK